MAKRPGDPLKNGLTVYLGHVLSPIDERELIDYRRGALVVDSSGTIVEITDWQSTSNRERYATTPTIDFGNQLIMPGFVDMHIHLPQVTQTGKSGQTLLGWLNDYIFPAEAKFSATEHARKISQWFFNELAANGSTTAVVFTTVHREATDIAFETAAAKGNRVVMGKVLMDRNSPASLQEETRQSLDDSHWLASKWHGYDGGRMMYAFTPRFAVTSTVEQLKGVAELWQEHKGTYVHTHVAESQEEVKVVASQYGNARSYLDVYDGFGLVGERSVYAHAIHLNEEDMRVCATKQAALAHCPSSNFFLKSGVFPWRQVEKHNVHFGLGSDVAAGPEMTMFSVMRDANYIQPDDWIAPRELFYRATLGGAVALKLENVCGSLQAGKEADFIVVDPTRRSGIADDILEQSTDDILSALVFLGDDRLIMSTFVRGARIFERTAE